MGITNFRNYHSLNVGNSNVGNSEGYYLGITNIQNYQSLEFSTETPNANPGMG